MAAVDCADSPGTKHDPLRTALDQLRIRLAMDESASDCDWAEAVCYALSRTERALHRQSKSVRGSGRLTAEVDQMPILIRLRDELCRLYRNLREQALALKWEAHRIAKTLGWKAQISRPRSDSSTRQRILAGLREQVEVFVGTLEKAWKMENAMVLEGVTTDIGVRDCPAVPSRQENR